MNEEVIIYLAAGIGILFSFCFTPLFAKILRKKSIFDLPTARSSHSVIALRGLGLATCCAFVFVILGIDFYISGTGSISQILQINLTLIGSVALTVTGFFEDVKGISIRVRLFTQASIGAISGLVLFLHTPFPVVGALLGLFCTPIFVNVHNFMDGVDGISGLQGVVGGLFFAVLGFLVNNFELSLLGATISSVFLGFLPWNLSQKGWFLGDAGSYFLGSVLCFTVLAAWALGISPIGLIGPFVAYFADTSFTLVSRIRRNENLAVPHKTHVYQLWALKLNNHLAASSITTIVTITCSLIGLLVIAGSISNFSAILFYITAGTAYAISPRISKRHK